MSKIWMIVGAVIVVVVVGVAVWFGLSGPGEKPALMEGTEVGRSSPASEVSGGDATESALKEGDRILGDPAAPVTVIEYASLTCPHCANFHTITLPKLEDEYIEAGKVKLVYRNFPLDQLALRAAGLAACVSPERYFGFLGLLFESQSSWATAQDPLEALARLGRTAGLDDVEIDACLSNDDKLDEIVSERLEAEQSYSISSTPSFIIGGQKYSGALTMEQLQEIIGPMLP